MPCGPTSYIIHPTSFSLHPVLDVVYEMCEHKFEIIEHTADKGIRAFGNTPGQALETAAYAMFSLMAELERYEPEQTLEIAVEGQDAQMLLHAWLSELLFGFEVDGLLPVDFEVTEFEEWRLKAKIAARRIGPDIQWLGSAVKAVTFHELKFERLDGNWVAQAIVDV